MRAFVVVVCVGCGSDSLFVYDSACVGTGPGASVRAAIWADEGTIERAVLSVPGADGVSFPLALAAESQPLTQAVAPMEVIEAGPGDSTAIQSGFSKEEWDSYYAVEVEVDSVPEWAGLACPPDQVGELAVDLVDGRHLDGL